MKNKKGFTLLELLVVVLIIGILASIALPQYKMAVTKARVASILPLMRRWKDALAEYALQHGDYEGLDAETCGATLGVNWPSDWNDGDCGDSIECGNDYWYCLLERVGYIIKCEHCFDGMDNCDDTFQIQMYPPDSTGDYEDLKNMTICQTWCAEGHKVCKALGGKLVDGYNNTYQL